jgi:GNAT superfamily N-acetyltransferase
MSLHLPTARNLAEMAAMIGWGSATRATLTDGTRLILRPSVPGDDERLRALFYRLSPTTVYRRLFIAAPHAPHWAERFAALATSDGDRRVAVLAMIEGEVAGFANFAREAVEDEAEMAIVVEDDWQGRGLGRALMAELVVAARRRGIAIFNARILGDNARALRFVTRFFPDATVRWDDGDYALRACLTVA